jgi:hypothetical protein
MGQIGTKVLQVGRVHGGVRKVLGDAAWHRLPAAVRARFGEPVRKVDYIGEFEVVRANAMGRMLAWICQLIGTPVVPRTGTNVPAIVHVGPTSEGVAWNREYRWPRRDACFVRSTKVFDANGSLVEKLPACLCMPLEVYEREGSLHFVSRGYYFELSLPGTASLLTGSVKALARIHSNSRRALKLWLPKWASPGTTHVEHIDEANGWFRFTMTVTHPLFGELFYQTGRFRAAEGCL